MGVRENPVALFNIFFSAFLGIFGKTEDITSNTLQRCYDTVACNAEMVYGSHFFFCIFVSNFECFALLTGELTSQ